MDICSHCGKSVSEDVYSFNDLKQSPASPKQCTCAAIGDGSVNDLGYTLGESLHIQDAEESVNTSDIDVNSDMDEGNLCGEIIIGETKSAQKCLCKSATFPCHGKMLSSDASTDEEDETPDTVLPENCNRFQEKMETMSPSISLPTPLKIVSAMKGSREKQQGAPPMKLTVKWAPDVYDPPPMILYPVKNKNQQRSKINKKNGKGKQKGSGNSGKAPRGSSGKDKKQFRKLVGSSDKCFKSLDARDRLVDYTDSSEDFDVGSPDSYCGSSFLRKSLSKVHISVAEAL